MARDIDRGAMGVRAELARLASPDKAAVLARFFKTGPGEYGDGDCFLGVTVPAQRTVARTFRDLSLHEIGLLLSSAVHEERLTALLVLVAQYRRGDEAQKAERVTFYLEHLDSVNSWDLVDTTAPHILGDWLLGRDRRVLRRLARSRSVWERRVAMVACHAFIRAGESADAFAIAERLLDDEHDLVHKAVGWMLREVGKRVAVAALRDFLEAHATRMPRTALRYAIERLPERERKAWLARRR